MNTHSKYTSLASSPSTHISVHGSPPLLPLDTISRPRPAFWNFIKSTTCRRWFLFIILIALIVLFTFLVGEQLRQRAYEKLTEGTFNSEEDNLDRVKGVSEVLKDAQTQQPSQRYDRLSDYFPVVESKEQGKGLRVAIITFFSPDADSQALKSLTFDNFLAYGLRHNYTVIDSLSDPALRALYHECMKQYSVPHYFKFQCLLHFLPKYDWIMWADGDSIFLNQSIPIETWLDPDYDMVLSVNPKLNDYSWSMINNSGHFFLKNSNWSTELLKEAIYMSERSCREFVSMVPRSFLSVKSPPAHVTHEARSDGEESKSVMLNHWIELCSPSGQYWLSDQGVIQWLIMFKPESFRCHVQFRGFRDFNSEFPWYADGDFVLHFPGKTLTERQALIPLFLRHMDPLTGKVDTSGHPQMAPVANNVANQKDMYAEWYAPMNMPCRVYDSLLKQKRVIAVQ